MFYFSARINYEEDHIGVYSHSDQLKKDTVVVVPIYGDEFAIATVLDPIDELVALTQYQNIEPIISTVDVSGYKKRKEAKVRTLMIQRAMDSKIEQIKMADTLKKFAAKDAEFMELYKEFQSLNTSPKSAITAEEIEEL